MRLTRKKFLVPGAVLAVLFVIGLSLWSNYDRLREAWFCYSLRTASTAAEAKAAIRGLATLHPLRLLERLADRTPVGKPVLVEVQRTGWVQSSAEAFLRTANGRIELVRGYRPRTVAGVCHMILSKATPVPEHWFSERLTGVERTVAMALMRMEVHALLARATWWEEGERDEVGVSRHPGGQLAAEGPLSDDGWPTGIWSYWHPNGKKGGRIDFGEKGRVKSVQWWDEEGRPLFRGQFLNRMKVDTWTYWLRSGNKKTVSYTAPPIR